MLPTLEIVGVGKTNLSSFDIHHPLENGNVATEFTPIKIDPEKLKAYVVPYIDMTHEHRVGNKRKYQRKVPFENCDYKHFVAKGFKKE